LEEISEATDEDVGPAFGTWHTYVPGRMREEDSAAPASTTTRTDGPHGVAIRESEYH
jgi:hypothetical protein